MTIEASKAKKELAYVFKRNEFVGSLKSGDEPLYRKRKFPGILALRIAEIVLIGSSELKGTENLKFVEQYSKNRITFAANHTSDCDHASLENALMQNGYGNIADKLLFPAGLKMWDRDETRWGMWGMNTFPTAAPSYYEIAQELSNLSTSPEEKKELSKYIENLNWLTRASLKAVLSDWVNGKVFIVVYPETTRSRNGLIQRGRPETELYFKKGLIMPYMIEGPENAFPPERDPDWGLVIRRGWKNKIRFSQPVTAEALWQPRTIDWLNEREANQVDFVMSRIAVLNPDRVDPKYRPLYQSLAEDIPQGLLVTA